MNAKSIQSVALSIAFLQDDQLINVRLLEIPCYILLTFSTKPRKWLFYAAYAILGVNGTLYLDYPYTLDLEAGVEPGDHFTYHADDEPIYVDLEGRTDDSYSSGWATVPTEFGDYYGGCPFSRRMIGACGAGHLVPLAKGTHFLRDLLRLRGERDDNIDIDDPSNILVMRGDIHKVYHEQKTVAFLRTPNIALKSNELPGAEDMDANSYRVTLHCFDGEDPKTSNHGDFSDLGRCSGRRDYLSSGYQKDLSEKFRPKDAILDVTYGYHLLRSWGTDEAKKVLAEHKNSLTGYSPPCDCHPVRQKRRPDEEEGDEDFKSIKQIRSGCEPYSTMTVQILMTMPGISCLPSRISRGILRRKRLQSRKRKRGRKSATGKLDTSMSGGGVFPTNVEGSEAERRNEPLWRP